MRTQTLTSSMLITQLNGQVERVLPDGTTLPVKVGDVLPSGTVLNIADDAQLNLAPVNAEPAATESGADVPATGAPAAPAVNAAAPGADLPPEIAALQQSILQGVDPTQQFEAAAAGGTPAAAAGANGVGGVAGASGNGGFVVITRTGAATIAQAGFDTSYQSDFQRTEQEVQPLGLDEPALLSDGDEALQGKEDNVLFGNVLDNAVRPVGAENVVVKVFTWQGQTALAGQTLTIAGVGTLRLEAEGQFTFTPAKDFNGPVPVVEYVVTDGELEDSSTLTLTITPVDDPVTLRDLELRGGEGVVYEAGLLAGRGADESAGSAPSQSTVFFGSFKVTAPDGLASVY
ncbi:MAG: retention module-containing protein, partial [Aeromonas sp.]